MEQLPRCNRGIDSEVEDEARASACEARDSIATFANFLEQQQRLLVHWLRAFGFTTRLIRTVHPQIRRFGVQTGNAF